MPDKECDRKQHIIRQSTEKRAEVTNIKHGNPATVKGRGIFISGTHTATKSGHVTASMAFGSTTNARLLGAAPLIPQTAENASHRETHLLFAAIGYEVFSVIGSGCILSADKVY